MQPERAILQQSSASGSPTLPPRPNATPEEILAITIQLIAEYDISGVTVDMVAEMAGVSKATIYRKWPSRADLIYDALAYVPRPGGNPDTGSLRGDLSILLGDLVAYLEQPQAGRVFASFLNAAVRNPQLGALRQQTTKAARASYEQVLQRAVARGELADDVDILFLVDTIISPFLYHSMVDPTATQPRPVQPVIDMILKAFAREDA
jgi:AcrR family transcriptional regulator